MSELSPDARDLVAQARKQGPELLGPSAAQRARLREKLTPLWAAEAPAAPARSGLRWKLASVVVIAGLGALGAVFMRPEPEPVLRAPSSSQQPAPAGVSENAAATTSLALGAAPMEQTASPPTAALAAAARTRLAREAAAREQVAPLPTAAAARTHVRPGALTPPGKPVPARQLDRKAETGGPSAVPVRPVDASATSDQDAPSEPSARERALAAQARRAQLQPAQERLPLTASEDRTPARSVDTEQDPAPPSIDGELELLGAAQAALQKQRPSRALTLLQEHAFRFPTGSLVEERMAMQALALCALQRRHAAATVLANLEARGSTSQLIPRVRSQCGL